MSRYFYFVLLDPQTFYISEIFLLEERSVQIPDIVQMREKEK